MMKAVLWTALIMSTQRVDRAALTATGKVWNRLDPLFLVLALFLLTVNVISR